MQLARPVIALDPRSFGRGRTWQLPSIEVSDSTRDDIELFATTFVAGFLFVSLLIA
jgi:hypothetical protein